MSNSFKRKQTKHHYDDENIVLDFAYWHDAFPPDCAEEPAFIITELSQHEQSRTFPGMYAVCQTCTTVIFSTFEVEMCSKHQTLIVSVNSSNQLRRRQRSSWFHFRTNETSTRSLSDSFLELVRRPLLLQFWTIIIISFPTLSCPSLAS